jgi:glycosyltransferase involved in cell wall biosynthesis
MGSSEVTFLLPAFNEQETIEKVVASLPRGSVLVVDDASTDKTAAIATLAGAEVLSLERNVGYDKALLHGLLWCKSNRRNLVVTADADGQHDTQELNLCSALLIRGAPLVLGRRVSFARWGEGLFSKYSRLRFKLNDPLCGVKGYNLSLTSESELNLIDNSVGSGLALGLVRRGVIFTELKITVSPRTSGSSRFGSGHRANVRILRAMLGQIRQDIEWMVRNRFRT